MRIDENVKNFVHLYQVQLQFHPLKRHEYLLPIQGFANLGTHEIGWSAAFALFGYSETVALTLAISTHIILLFFVLILGSLGYLLVSAKR